jgi:hypothetical protein
MKISCPRACFQTLYLPVCCKEDPPQPELKRGEHLLKVPLFNSDLGGSQGLKTRPSHWRRYYDVSPSTGKTGANPDRG